MNDPLVSIIVPCYNQSEYLPEALDSVLAQTYQRWECVIVNDGSPDNTEEIAKRYLDKDDRFVYVSRENGGLASARNAGIAKSRGSFILPLDADDRIAPTYIEKAVNRFSKVPETKVVYCKVAKFGIENELLELPPYEYESLLWRNCIVCSAMFKRVDYDKTNGYNENMVYGNEDWDFWLSLLRKDDVVFRIDEELFYYRIKETSMVKELLAKHKEASLVQLYKNHQAIYEPYMHDYCERIVFNKMEIAELPSLRLLYDSYVNIRKSKAYRLGKTMLKPFSWIRNKALK
ncbi:MAG: glycosyltransferase family 2 protein [Bacteroidales bacterium]|nr:glycosyltransferase family 2 protein [Bacteroidales bacterium]